jgi:Mg-chelatase subunit ChlD
LGELLEKEDRLFLVDTSASMAERVGPDHARKIDIVKAGLKQFCLEHWPEMYYDRPLRMGIVIFRQTGLPATPYFEQLVPLFPTPAVLEVYRIDEIRVRGSSPLYEALKYASSMMWGSTRPVRRVKLIGDGDNDGPDPMKEVDQVVAEGIRVDCVEVSERASKLMTEIATRTGGKHSLVDSSRDIRKALEE